jgi:hypothetical protein
MEDSIMAISEILGESKSENEREMKVYAKRVSLSVRLTSKF